MKYAIIPADGHAPTHAVVYSSHADKGAAIRAAQSYNRTATHKVQVIECELRTGERIYMNSVGRVYPRIAL